MDTVIHLSVRTQVNEMRDPGGDGGRGSCPCHPQAVGQWCCVQRDSGAEGVGHRGAQSRSHRLTVQVNMVVFLGGRKSWEGEQEGRGFSSGQAF